jgi:microcystin-dependent protein
MEGTIATILIFAGNFAPRGWLFCAGQPLSIAEYDVLFSLIGTTYGGDGVQTFNLPDLRGRAPIGTGTFAGMFTVSLGEKAGYESVTLNSSQLPAHNHVLQGKLAVSTANADGSNDPTRFLANTSTNVYAPPSSGNGSVIGGASVALNPAGSNAPISIVQSYQVINYVICYEGIYPSRP